MGALEFAPVLGPRPRKASKIEVDTLVRLAGEVLTHRNNLRGHFHEAGKAKALRDILSVGTSAGGARAKAVIAWNRGTNEVRSGQIAAGEGFDYWLLKFDGVAGNKDNELEDPKGYGAIEFAYHLMAKAGGITMSESRLLEEQFRRMVFNIVARNQDDHVKNIAFLMNQRGEWSLAPAFDVTYSYNPSGAWTATHQMTLNGKRDGFTLADFEACAKAALMKRGRAAAILKEVTAAARRWPEFAAEARLADEWRDKIRKTHRLSFPPA